jgi:hypothetical protein
MEKRDFLKTTGKVLSAAAVMPASLGPTNSGAATAAASVCSLKPGEIQHMVIFNLKHPKDSKAASVFLGDGGKILSAIPGVRNFQAFSQVSKKNDYDFGFSMVFSGASDYQKYNSHPDHVNFVEKRWKTEVSRFLEIDFEAPAIGG